MSIEVGTFPPAPTSPSLGDVTPGINTVLPHILGNTYWTTEVELEILDFADSCEDYASCCEKSSIQQHRWGTFFRILSMLCSGSAAIIPNYQSINADVANYAATASASISLIAGVIQSVCSFEKNAGNDKNATIQLREISKELRHEISKPLAMRWVNPYEKLTSYEERLHEILNAISPKVISNDTKARIKTARMARIRTSKHDTVLSPRG